MSKEESPPLERLRVAGATDLERRLLEAAGREQPSRELSERMAQAIGIPLIAPGPAATGGLKTDIAAGAASRASSSLVPWISGALLVAGLVTGASVAVLHRAKPASPSALAAPAASVAPASALSNPTLPLTPLLRSEAAPETGDESSPKTPSPASSQRGHRATAAGDLANQIALVDGARSALAAGKMERALSLVREYQKQYPSGTFQPEVAAVKIEALVKMGRSSEASTLAERFIAAYGPGPLADRVAHLAHIAEP